MSLPSEPSPDVIQLRGHTLVAASGGAEAPADGGSDFSVPGLLRAFRRRWYLVLPLAVVAAAAAVWGARAFLPSPTYTARTLLHVAADRPHILSDTGDGRNDFASYQRSQAATVRSRWVLRSALAELNGQHVAMLQGSHDPVGYLEKEIQADYGLAPEIMRITLKGEQPDELLLLLNTIRDAYLREVLNKDRTDRQGQVEQLKTLVAGNDDAQRKLRRQLDEKAAGVGARDPQILRQKHQNALAQVAALEQEHGVLQLKIARQELDLAAMEKRADAKPAPDAVEAEVAKQLTTDGATTVLIQQISALQEDVADYQIKLKTGIEAPPGLRDKLAALDAAEKALAARRATAATAATARLLDRSRADRAAAVLALRETFTTDTQYERILREKIDGRARDLGTLAAGISSLDSVRDEIARTEDYGKKAAARLQALEIELQAPPRATPLEEAVIIQAPNPMKQMLQTVVPGVGAFLLVLLGGTWLEYQTGRISSSADVSQRLGNVIVTEVPRVADRIRFRLTPPEHSHELVQHNRLTDAVDMARALLLGSGPGKDCKVVMVTSARQGEGKTSLAVQLAVSLARGGRPTVLVDADFRCPNLHNVLGLPLGPGLGELLQGTHRADEVIRPQDELFVVTAGECDVRTALGLFQGRLAVGLETLKQQFDFVVLDAPPVLDLPDAILIGRTADGTILSTLRDVSRLPQLRAALDRLGVLDIPVLGAVLNGTPMSSEYSLAGRH
jgi:Mrp family chromosome partitioning ATPase